MSQSSERLNLLDLAKSTNPNGDVAMVAEVLDEMNTIIQDMPVYPSNAALGHRVTLRSSLPVVRPTRINQGSTVSKGTYTQRVDTMAIFDGMSEVDLKVKIGMGEAKFNRHRFNQDMAFVESISQAFAEYCLYGDEEAEAEAFTGFMLRMNTLSLARSGPRVISAGGAGADNSSIYAIDWHERYAHGIYPEGTTGGIEKKNLGEVRVTDRDGNPFMAACTNYLLAIGVTVEDPRHIGRLANIEISAIADAGEAGYAGAELLLLLTDLMSEMPDPGGAKRILYTNVKVHAAIHKLALAKANAALTIADYMGKGLTPHFWGYPIRRVDQISDAESVVA